MHIEFWCVQFSVATDYVCLTNLHIIVVINVVHFRREELAVSNARHERDPRRRSSDGRVSDSSLQQSQQLDRQSL